MSTTKKVMACPICDGDLIVRNGRHGDFLGCSNWPACTVTHSMHDDGTPMGIPADRETRHARKLVHDRLDAIWMAIVLKAWAGGIPKTRYEARSQVYLWLGDQMELSESECHIGRFNLTQCDVAQAFLDELTSEDVARMAAPFDWLAPDVAATL